MKKIFCYPRINYNICRLRVLHKSCKIGQSKLKINTEEVRLFAWHNIQHWVKYDQEKHIQVHDRVQPSTGP